MNLINPEGRHRRFKETSGREASVRRGLALTVLGASAATGAAVGPLGAGVAQAETRTAADRGDVAAADPQGGAEVRSGGVRQAGGQSDGGTTASSTTASGTTGTAADAASLALVVHSWPRSARSGADIGTSTATAATAATAKGSPAANALTRPAVDGPPSSGPGASNSSPWGGIGGPGAGTSAPGTLGPTPAYFDVPVALAADTTQVITVKASGTYATVDVWQETAAGWHVLASTTAARVGANGIANGATRQQGTDTTPTGTYTITQGFGVGANPGTLLPYHVVTSQDWWVEDPTSAYYNQMRTAAQGGFQLTQSGPDGSEQLIDYPVQYNNALVINYNMDPAVPGRGAGIFLHDLGPQAGPTGGCVAVPADFLTQIMRWIDPAQHPLIAIG